MDRHNITYYKIVRNDYIHNNFTYKLGLNIDPIKFNPIDLCRPRGLYFTDFDNLGTYFNFRDLVAIIKIPNNPQVYKDPFGTKWKADHYIIEKIDSIDPYWNIYIFCVKISKTRWSCILHYNM